MSDQKLCFGCMNPLGSDERVCAHCGYEQNATTLANYLKPGTLLHERYLIGKMLDANGESVTYIGYDTSVNCKVRIREYFPERLCSRVHNSSLIDVNYEHLAQYKSLMAEYTELNKALARMRNLNHLNPAVDMFSENNTTYAVYEYLEGRTLLDYLKENAGELKWDTVRCIFSPLFTSLSLLHNAGVLHRGLSPETIFVTDKGEIKLTGFCISAVRTNDTELDAELFDGYAAPEQYFADKQQGTWTDVYGICAVLYRILTGCRASDGMTRLDYDNLVPPNELEPKIPENVSDAIMNGLLLDTSARIRTITDLVTMIFNTDSTAELQVPDEAGFTSPVPANKSSTMVFHPHNTAEHSSINQAANPQPRRQNAPENGQRPVRPHQNPNGQSRNPNGQRPPQRGGQRPPQRNGQRPPQNGAQGQRRPAPRSPEAAARARQAAMRNGQPQGSRRPVPAGNMQNYKAREYSVFERIRAPLFIAILFILIATLVIWAVIRVLGGLNGNNDVLSKDKNTSVSDNVVSGDDNNPEEPHRNFAIPELVGKSYSLKKEELEMEGLLVLEPEFVFREDHPKDKIFEQDIEPRTYVAMGSTLKVKVSLGTPNLVIPDFKDLKLSKYLKMLDEMGLSKAIDGGGNNNIATNAQNPYAWQYQAKVTTTTNPQNATTTTTTSKDGKKHIVKYVSRVDYNYSNGYVCAVEPPPGTPFNALDDYEITVYYAYNPVYIKVTMTGTSTTKTGTGTKNTKLTGSSTTTKTTAKTTTKPKEETEPPVTEPPKTDPPPPPATEPPPPVTDPPPPVTDPPPPVTDPPPPVTDPPPQPEEEG